MDMRLEVSIEQDDCTSCGRCPDIAPQHFYMADDGIAYVKQRKKKRKDKVKRDNGDGGRKIVDKRRITLDEFPATASSVKQKIYECRTISAPWTSALKSPSGQHEYFSSTPPRSPIIPALSSTLYPLRPFNTTSLSTVHSCLLN